MILIFILNLRINRGTCVNTELTISKCVTIACNHSFELEVQDTTCYVHWVSHSILQPDSEFKWLPWSEDTWCSDKVATEKYYHGKLRSIADFAYTFFSIGIY